MPQPLRFDLYVITAQVPRLGRSHQDVAAAALAAGVRVIQFRDKTMSTRELVGTAQELRQMTRDKGALLIVNDRMDVALAVEADGAHLGPVDMPLPFARRLVRPDFILGASVADLSEAETALEQGADYLSLGSIYATASKADAGAPIGLEPIRAIKQAVKAPLIAIGGINRYNITEVIRAGADGAAVIAAVSEADDMEAEARNLREMILAARAA